MLTPVRSSTQRVRDGARAIAGATIARIVDTAHNCNRIIIGLLRRWLRVESDRTLTDKSVDAIVGTLHTITMRLHQFEARHDRLSAQLGRESITRLRDDKETAELMAEISQTLSSTLTALDARLTWYEQNSRMLGLLRDSFDKHTRQLEAAGEASSNG